MYFFNYFKLMYAQIRSETQPHPSQSLLSGAGASEKQLRKHQQRESGVLLYLPFDKLI
ncbi:unnamed protein product [Brassica rapa]|uniref:Uncharacterized protein n=2 Tax=Brassica TaxID=3705 RepID=A0A8D9DN85_BRACM|nr:unnamed protein product [Brassica napus]CAG7879386.1 unnamed protein product [Brassica rapa]